MNSSFLDDYIVTNPHSQQRWLIASPRDGNEWLVYDRNSDEVVQRFTSATAYYEAAALADRLYYDAI